MGPKEVGSSDSVWHAVATSDPDDLLRIDHALPVIKV